MRLGGAAEGGRKPLWGALGAPSRVHSIPAPVTLWTVFVSTATTAYYIWTWMRASRDCIQAAHDRDRAP
jgi:hypothetical protein